MDPVIPAGGPVGRRREWNQLSEIVAARRSAVILLAGPEGSGRTHMLRALSELAEREGFFVPNPPEPLPPLEPTSSLADIHRTLSAVFEVRSDAQAASATLQGRPQIDASDVESGLRQMMEAPAGSEELVETLPETSLRSRAGSAVRLAGRAMTQFFSQHRAILSLVRQRAPVFLGIDGYNPSELVNTWIVSGLIPTVRSMKDPVVIVFVDRATSLERLSKHADFTCTLGPLDVDEVADHLRRVGAGVRPPLDANEVDSYAKAAAIDPRLLQSFESVFEAASLAGAR